MTCRTPNCGRAIPYAGQAYCRDCLPVVLRTGHEPELPVFVPAWRKRLVGKDMTRSAA